MATIPNDEHPCRSVPLTIDELEALILLIARGGVNPINRDGVDESALLSGYIKLLTVRQQFRDAEEAAPRDAQSAPW